jgi:hypothetical protein
MAKISFDFEAIKERVIKKLSSESEWANFLSYSAIDNVVSAIVNEMTYDIQYSEYNTIENFWNMARNKSSLLQMSPMHGFQVPRKIASSGTIRISTSENFDTSYGVNINIPRFFQFFGNDIYVCTDNNYTLNSNEPYVDVTCVQGEVRKISFLAEGINYEEKVIYDEDVDNSNFVLTVNNDVEPWKCVKSLFLCKPTDKVYQIVTLPNLKGIKILFGNDVFGKKLSKNDTITFTYISTLGSNGNIYSSDIINNVESQAFDNNGNVVKLYCKNITSFIGGEDSPSIDYIREVSPKVYQTGERASSKDDYYTIIRQDSRISKIAVWGAYETLKDAKKDIWDFIPSEENVVHLALLDDAYEPLNNDLKTDIAKKLYSECDPTDLLSFEDVNKIPMIFYINATLISPSYTTSEVESYIRTALNDTYGIDKMDFGMSVYDSDYVRLIDEVKGVDNHISEVKLYKEGRFLKGGNSINGYYGNFTLPIYPIDYSSISIYIKDTSIENSKYDEFATCDANGNIIGVGIYVTTDSNIDLNKGVGTLQITNGLTSNYENYMFKIIYKYIEDDLINTKRSNLLYYDDAVIKLNYK